MSSKLILASQSPQRRQLLSEAGYDFETIEPSPDAESGVIPDETPPDMVARLARQKAADVAQRLDEGLIVACDTVAECQGQVLGKPRDVHHAREMLELLRGRPHHVYSGLCVWRLDDNLRIERVASTKLRMEKITDRQLKKYLDSGGWVGKAGAFGFQDRLEWIEILAGSESNVIGLPLELLAKVLEEMKHR